MLDANILIRAVLGVRVHFLLLKYAEHAEFAVPDTAFQEARDEILTILEKRKMPVAPALAVLDSLANLVLTVEFDRYGIYDSVARARIARRDEDDWPILAKALALGCPIWTEDTDFFGCGVATWTSDRVEMFLKEGSPE